LDLKSKLDELQKKLDLSGEKVAALEKEKGQLIKVTHSKMCRAKLLCFIASLFVAV
jgi:hypothetical protein